MKLFGVCEELINYNVCFSICNLRVIFFHIYINNDPVFIRIFAKS